MGINQLVLGTINLHAFKTQSTPMGQLSLISNTEFQSGHTRCFRQAA